MSSGIVSPTLPRVRAPDRVSDSALFLFLVPLGRVLFAAIFVLSGLGHFSSGTIAYAASAGVPSPNILVPISGVLAVVGGLMVALGLYARLGALLLVVFLVPVTILMHAFWAAPDQQAATMQYVHFMKNVAMLGAALMLLYFGAGPGSIDAARGKPRMAQVEGEGTA